MQNIDFSILNFIQEHFRCAVLDVIMPVITHLGDKGIVWIIIAVLLCFFPKDRRFRQCGIEVLIALTVGVIVGNLIVKNIVCRDRPCWINELDTMLIAVPRDYSFPSGHTLSSFAAAAVLMYRNRRAGIGVYALAALIAFSRMYLYVHFPTDILGGIVIGTAVAFASIYIADKRIFKAHKG